MHRRLRPEPTASADEDVIVVGFDMGIGRATDIGEPFPVADLLHPVRHTGAGIKHLLGYPDQLGARAGRRLASGVGTACQDKNRPQDNTHRSDHRHLLASSFMLQHCDDAIGAADGRS